MSVPSDWRTVARVVFPEDGDPTTLPLYVDDRPAAAGRGPASTRSNSDSPLRRTAVSTTPGNIPAAPRVRSVLRETSRRESVIAPDSYVSFASYFNAFPASYWQRWTDVNSIRLVLSLDGSATVDVFRSTARGSFNRIDGARDATGILTFDIPLTTFGDGGWLWFDITTASAPVRLASAEWQAPAHAARRAGSLTLSITTFNRPADCIDQIRRLSASDELLQHVDEILFVDQGRMKVREAPGFGEAAAPLGERLRIVDQPNLGGSGGFSRGMSEVSKAEKSDYVLLLDDDVIVETEGILRAVRFSDFAVEPTIVGGHMLSLYDRAVLHSYGEEVDIYRAMWQPVREELEALDFAAQGLRTVPSVHRRVDVGYNGWWMCLVPRVVIDTIGLALPAFIKWDDAEYGMRAAEHGIPTVTLPGAAVWHMPWTEKDDRLDWQAYFHQRNRWVVGLSYSTFRRGGRLPRESFTTDVMHLVSLQYSPVAMRNQALRDVLSGPSHLHRTLGGRLADVRRIQGRYPDSKMITDADAYAPVTLGPTHDRLATPRTAAEWAARVVKAFLRAAAVPVRSYQPQIRIPAPDARWWRLATLDSALVGTADGTGATLYQRSRTTFWGLLRESRRLHRELRRRWPALATEYKAALPTVTSQEAWSGHFAQGSAAGPS